MKCTGDHFRFPTDVGGTTIYPDLPQCVVHSVLNSLRGRNSLANFVTGSAYITNNMKIDKLSQLKSLLKLCQEHGVTSIDVDGIKMNISLKPQIRANNALELQPEAYVQVPRYAPVQAQETQDEAITTPDALSQDQLLYYSSKAEPQ